MEKTYKPYSGYSAIVILLFVIAGLIYSIVSEIIPLIIILALAIPFTIKGLIIVNPNDSFVLNLFGEYKGTLRQSGFGWINPFFKRKLILVCARNINSEPIKVNDKIGNPVMIGIVLVWKVNDTYKAAFEVDDFKHFVEIQSDAAIRKLAGSYPYDNFESELAEITLRGGGEEVNQLLEEELSERLNIAGVEVLEARINYLAYASEIAGAMLRRQQASAIVAARQKVVEGAVGMVKLALDELKTKEIIDLDDEKKATMVSNLLVVLCADESARPVINTGSIY
jgi:regulator of protease activity HflC (stomatin/prohibitin superfamily)